MGRVDLQDHQGFLVRLAEPGRRVCPVELDRPVPRDLWGLSEIEVPQGPQDPQDFQAQVEIRELLDFADNPVILEVLVLQAASDQQGLLVLLGPSGHLVFQVSFMDTS